MDDQVSQKGTKTRAREATHGPLLVSAAKCPQCPHRHVVQREINGLLRRLCGACGFGWYPTAAELEAERGPA